MADAVLRELVQKLLVAESDLQQVAARLSGRVVLLRADLNVPVNERGAITDTTRLKAVLPTIQWLLDAGAKVRT